MISARPRLAPDLEVVQHLMESASFSGRYAKVILEQASYRPSPREQDRISMAVYGVHSDGYRSTPLYREMGKREGSVKILNPERPLIHTALKGDLWIFTDDDDRVLYCSPHITELTDEIPEINMGIISPRALWPKRHSVQKVGNIGRKTGDKRTMLTTQKPVSVYTRDEDGSTWSFHGRY